MVYRRKSLPAFIFLGILMGFIISIMGLIIILNSFGNVDHEMLLLGGGILIVGLLLCISAIYFLIHTYGSPLGKNNNTECNITVLMDDEVITIPQAKLVINDDFIEKLKCGNDLTLLFEPDYMGIKRIAFRKLGGQYYTFISYSKENTGYEYFFMPRNDPSERVYEICNYIINKKEIPNSQIIKINRYRATLEFYNISDPKYEEMMHKL